MGFVGPFTYNGVRFALGSLSLLPLVCLRRNAPAGRRPPLGRGRAALLRYGLAAGAVLFVASSLQQQGMVTTSAGKAGFITGLYVVLVPLSGLLWGQRAGWGRFLGAALAVAGLYLLSVTGGFAVARGDLLVLVSALFWAAHVHLIGWASPRVDSLELAALQFAVCSVLTPPRAAAVFGLTSATLSHVTFVSGLGSSCSQPRFAKRPSKTAGSVRKAISGPLGSASYPARKTAAMGLAGSPSAAW